MTSPIWVFLLTAGVLFSLTNAAVYFFPVSVSVDPATNQLTVVCNVQWHGHQYLVKVGETIYIPTIGAPSLERWRTERGQGMPPVQCTRCGPCQTSGMGCADMWEPCPASEH